MRFPAGPTSPRRLATLVLLAALGGQLAACSDGSQAKLEAARHQLERGHLDRVLAILEDASGPEASALRARVAEKEAVRAAALEELEGFRRSRGERELNELLVELRAMLADQDDPVAEEWIRQEMSHTSDWIAERNASRPRGAKKTAGGPPDDADTDAATGDALMKELLADIERAKADDRWSQALEGIDRLAADAPALADLLVSRRREVLAAAAAEAEALVETMDRVERDDGLEAAWESLREALWRFPPPPAGGGGGAVAELHAAERDLRRRYQALRSGGVQIAGTSDSEASTPLAENPQPVEASTQEVADAVDPVDPADFALEAHRAAEAGELERAAELWSAAAAASADGEERTHREHRAWSLERRLELRRELDDPERDWAQLEPADFAELVATVELSSGAAIGGCLERLRSSAHPATEVVHEAALDDLATLLDDGSLAEEHAWRVLAEYRREPLPVDGYRYVRGDWLSLAELEEASLVRRLERLLKDVARADDEKRAEITTALAELVAESEVGAERLAELIRPRGEAAIRRMGVGLTWKQLEEVARAREELDRLRAKALALVADEERYFYPYNPPADPGKSYADYVSVQREISAATDAVRELWERDPGVDLPSDFREAAGVLEFLLAQPAEWWGGLETPGEWPAWNAGVDLSAERVGLRTFAWTAAERAVLRDDEAIVALNEQRSSAAAEAGPDIEERRALELANNYRRMLGRRALAWDARLFTASEWHSAYMAETGHFGHAEPDRAGRVTPLDRMAAAGYEGGWNENCQAGTEWARRAFDSWRTSSEHHRTLVSDVPSEAAVARVGTYWTMNFGRGNDFENDLDPWRD